MITRSERYFSQQLGAATLRGAIEQAAELVRRAGDPGQKSPPIDVFKLAKSRGIEVAQDLIGSACPEGLLLPRNTGFTVRLRQGATKGRKRFSLAHEIGHTFFYRDGGQGPRHAIGVLDRAEQAAEERICDQFAGALLLPRAEVSQRLVGSHEFEPSRLLQTIGTLASTFWVSPTVMVSRMRLLEVQGPPCLVIYSSVRPNPKTRSEPALRVDFCLSLGDWQNYHVWRHRALSSIGLRGPESLYRAWNSVRCQGSFSLDDHEGLTSDVGIVCEVVESVKLSVVAAGKWKAVEESCVSASRLYGWQADSENYNAYIVSVIAPAKPCVEAQSVGGPSSPAAFAG